ncbi:MAG: DUF2891 family protein [Longimicrobiales bacterium]
MQLRNVFLVSALLCGSDWASAQTAAPDSARPKPPEFPDLASFYASLPVVQPGRLERANAIWLAAMPLSCMDHPHNHPTPPPYLWVVTYTPVPDFENTRAFYGCSDWHSAVNSAWTLVKLLKLVPDLPTAGVIRQKLNEHFGASNIAGDLEFFRGAGNFELPYGYAWLLRLQGELRSWNDPDAARWAANIQPLAAFMADRLVTYLKGLEQPVRTGVHPNTAMAMDNALDYAMAYDSLLERTIRESATRLFSSDKNCNTAAEPGGSDFLSPCLMEAAIMSRLLERSAFYGWLDTFLPPIHSLAFRPLTQPLGPEFVENPTAIAARSHIVALAFVRAKSMGELANVLPASDPRVPVLRRLAAIQAAKGFQVIGAVGYAGSHYYATFATTYLMTNLATQL